MEQDSKKWRVGIARIHVAMGTPNPARFSTVTSGGVVDSKPCPDVYRNLANRMPTQVTDLNNSLAVLVNPNLPAATAQGQIANQVWAVVKGCRYDRTVKHNRRGKSARCIGRRHGECRSGQPQSGERVDG